MSYLCHRLLDDKAFEQIALAESLKERDKLDVSKNYITCSGIKFMCNNWVKRWRNQDAALLPRFILRILKAHHDYIGDASAMTLAELLHNQGLQDLEQLHLSREHRAPRSRIPPYTVQILDDCIVSDLVAPLVPNRSLCAFLAFPTMRVEHVYNQNIVCE